MNKKLGGIILIVIALALGGYFIYSMMGEKEENTTVEVTATPTATTSTAVTASATATITVTASPIATAELPEDAVEESKGEIQIEMSDEVLSYIGVSREDFEREIRIYANGSGYSEAEKMVFQDEMIVEFAENNVTIPCYFEVDGEKANFDAIYNTETKEFRFVPW